MNKKILGLVLVGILTLGIVGCYSSNENNTKGESTSKVEENTKLSEKDMNIIEENLKTFTGGTAFDGATFKIEQDKKGLKVSVIKPITDIMAEYKTTTSDDTVGAIGKSLIFNDAYDSIKEEIKKDFDCMQVFIFNGEKEFNNNDYYTLKTIM